ncbi:MAG: AMIN domain-containing protein [Deltaproteobacteria bacterium]|nr:AMIN domain-containing protein [Deltaproteobacteria bacterium]
MSGRRSWGGYGLALGLVFITAGCGQRPKPPTPESGAAPPTEGRVEATEAAPAPAAVEAQEQNLRLKGIKLVEDQGQTGIFIKLSRMPDKVENFTLTKPDRLVIDLHGPVPADAQPLERAAVDDPRVSRVRVARQDGRLRVTVDVKGRTPYTVNDLKTMVVAFLGERSGAGGPAKSQVLYAEAEGGAEAAAMAGGPAMEMASVEPPTPERATETGRPVARVYTGQKISLDFKDADILNVLRILSEVGGENIIATDDVKGRITVRLVDVPWDQALDIVLQANRLDSVKVGNVRRVSTVTRLKEEREAQLAAEQAARELEPLKTAYIHVNYLKVTGKEVLPQLQGGGTFGSQEVCRNQATQGQTDQGDKIVDQIKDVLSERGKVRVDARSNTIVVRDIQGGIDAARDLVAKLDVPTPQVLIESNIVEATDTFTRDLGIQWGYQYAVGPQFGTSTGKEFPASIGIGGGTGGGSVDPPNFGLVPGTGPGAPVSGVFNAGPAIAAGVPGGTGIPGAVIPFIADFPASVSTGAGSSFDLALGSIDGSKALDARITALEREGQAKVISRPKVTTANNQNACIASVVINRVRLPSAGTIIGAGGGAQAVAFQEFTTGIVLQVVPQVSNDGFVLLQLKVVSSTPLPPQPPDNIPGSIDREASTTVLIKAGETLVLGGVFRDNSTDNETGIPWFRSIPGLGWLFKRMFRDNVREELLVFLTPRVVQGTGSTIGLPPAKQLWEHRAEPVEPGPTQQWKK